MKQKDMYIAYWCKHTTQSKSTMNLYKSNDGTSNTILQPPISLVSSKTHRGRILFTVAGCTVRCPADVQCRTGFKCSCALARSCFHRASWPACLVQWASQCWPQQKFLAMVVWPPPNMDQYRLIMANHVESNISNRNLIEIKSNLTFDQDFWWFTIVTIN